MLRSACYAALVALGVPSLARRLRAAGVLLCYHNVLPLRNAAVAGEAGVHIPFERFAEQVRWLAQKYAVVALREFVERLHAGRPLRGVAALTFDDGYDGVFQHAWPLLSDLGLPATVFVVAERPERPDAFWWDHPDIAAVATPTSRERWLRELKGEASAILSALSLQSSTRVPSSHRPAGWDAIAAAATAGLEIGVHSATHRTLTQLGDAELEHEIVASRETIRARAGVAPTLFAYPYGVWNPRVRDAVFAAGYRGAVTLDYGLVAAGADPWALRRVNIPAGITLAAFEAWVAGLNPRGGHG
jgi:peptidoglycan/xylan/chitin deacetylase (PgdA/CDA1 family)